MLVANDLCIAVLHCVAKLLSAQQPRLIAAACKAVGLIGVRCVFPIEDGQEDDKERPAEAGNNNRDGR